MEVVDRGELSEVMIMEALRALERADGSPKHAKKLKDQMREHPNATITHAIRILYALGSPKGRVKSIVRKRKLIDPEMRRCVVIEGHHYEGKGHR